MSDDCILQLSVVVPAQRRFRKAFDEFEVGSTSIVRMDKIGQMPVLELNRETKIESRAGLPQFAHDPDTMSDVAHVVVGHLENKKRTRSHAGAANLGEPRPTSTFQHVTLPPGLAL